jgi:cell division control protein 24
MTAQDTEQIYGIYLFENLILCCKEKDMSKSRKSRDSRSDVVMNDIKGKIYSTSISDVADNSDPDNGVFELRVYWNEGEESFVLKCRNIEQVELWRARILACTTGTSNFINGRMSTDGAPSKSSFRRTVQSINVVTSRPTNNETDKRTASLPAVARPVVKKGAHISPRGSSIYQRRDDGNRNQISSMSPSISKSMRNEIPLVTNSARNSAGPPRAQLPKAPLQSSLPPNSSLPTPPHNENTISQVSAPARLLSPPPSTPLPMPPQSTLPPSLFQPRPSNGINSSSRTSYSSAPVTRPPSGSLPAPPSGALPQPPSNPTAVKPPSAQLPQPPTFSPLTPGAKSPPPQSALPLPPSANGPPKSSLPTPPRDGLGGIPDSIDNMKISNITHVEPIISPRTTSVRRPSLGNSSGRNSVPGSSLIKMKTHYGELIFILAVPAQGAKFDDILDKVERKIKICGAPMPEGRRINLRYKDEEGDLVMLNSDDDIEMAFEMARTHSDKGSITIQAM